MQKLQRFELAILGCTSAGVSTFHQVSVDVVLKNVEMTVTSCMVIKTVTVTRTEFYFLDQVLEALEMTISCGTTTSIIFNLPFLLV